MDHCENRWSQERVRNLGRHGWIALLESHHYSPRRIGAHIGRHYTTVGYHLRKHGLWSEPKYRYRSQERWDEVLAPFGTMAEAAPHLGMTTGALRDRLRVCGIQHHFRRNGPGDNILKDVDTDDLLAILADHGGVRVAAAAALSVSSNTLRNELQRRGAWSLPEVRK